MKRIIVIFLCCFVGSVFAAGKVVNVYNWANVIPLKVLQQFQREAGIKVNYSTFDDNQMLYAKLKANANSGYDVAFPSTYIVDRMRKEGMLQKIAKAQLTNFKNLNPKLLNQSFDPQNQYSVPYLWGTTGIIVNAKFYVPASITSWQDLWQPRFRKQVGLLDDMRDVFNMAMRVSGYSINDANPQHIKQAYLQLKKLMPNVRSYDKNGAQQLFVNEDIKLGMMASGDAYNVIKQNPNLYFIYPKEGPNVWMDNMVIPQNAPHKENAYKFINFILRADVAKMIMQEVGYSTPNLAAIKLMPASIQQNHILNPTAQDLHNNESEIDFNKKTIGLYLKYWDKLRNEG
jgi:spermidine/putrescine transport system substrate-binding protein